MLDYKEEHPKEYWEMMHKLFNKDTGAGLTHVNTDLEQNKYTEDSWKTFHKSLRGLGYGDRFTVPFFVQND